ncbi:sensor histidine kinase [Crocosphaera sp.]|uniref:sensor histidine kinase n=1 Tax=Crocosphaera sp. TaxID=2729996 RepID=UPI003F1EAD16|nr:HAMP domain-containing sensor histidine kinase [Crocosphaera sp.]
MTHSPSNNNISQFLLQEIVNISDYNTNIENISKIIKDSFLVDFCFIISDLDSLKYLGCLNNLSTEELNFSEQKINSLLHCSWIKQLINKSQLKSITHLKEKTHPDLFCFCEGIKINSLLGMGTHFKGQTNGIIILGKKDNYRWSQKDKTKLKELENILGIAFHLSQVNTVLDEKNISKDSYFSLSNIPKLLEENPILRLWWESTRKQLERQLEWNRKIIYNMITIMSDQTRNPLAILKMGITVLRTRELSPEDFSKRLTMLEEAWSKLNNINEKILQLKHLKSQEISCNVMPVNLKELINNIIHSCHIKWQENTKTSLKLTTYFQLKSTQIIKTDIQHLTNILEELLNNASKFSVSNSTVTFRLTQDNDADQDPIIITITNITDCASLEHINEFFQPFYREQIVIDTAIPGIGVGLYIVKDLVELLQGKITIEGLPTENPKHCKIIVRLVLPQSLSSS